MDPPRRGSYPLVNTDDVRNALNSTAMGRLPVELRSMIEDEVPELRNARTMATASTNQGTNAHLQGTGLIYNDPSVPPKQGSPFLAIPAEIRRLIFTQYLLPEKSKNIEPQNYIATRGEFRSQCRAREMAIMRARARAQNHTQTLFQTPGHWNAQLAQPLPTYQLGPQQAALQAAQNNAIALLNGQNIAQTNAPPTANPMQGWTVNPNHQAAQPAASWLPNTFALGANFLINTFTPAHQTPNASSAQTGAPPGQNGSYNFITMPGGATFNQPPAQQQSNGAPPQPSVPIQVTGNAMTNGTTHGNITNNQVEDDHDAVYEEYKDKDARDMVRREVDKYDPSPENLVIALLTTNVQLCLEVSEILYEEYTFEVHIHSTGVDFLHFDRIPTLETWGYEIEQVMGAFDTRGHFCFHRMKHIEFVFFGGDPQDRLAALRMRESIRKLVDFLRREKKPPTTIMVRFDYERDDTTKDWSLANAITDEVGTIWAAKSSEGLSSKLFSSERRGKQARSSIIHEVSNIELVCAPLKALRKVSKVELQTPTELLGNSSVHAYGLALSDILTSHDMTLDAEEELMREEMIMDARRDKELQLAGAGGYYKQLRLTVDDEYGTTGTMNASDFLADEAELDEDGLIQPFGGFAHLDEDDEDIELDPAHEDLEMEDVDDDDEMERAEAGEPTKDDV